jgi:hypothetical protein
MLSDSISRTSLCKASTRFARRLLMTAAVVALPCVVNAQSSGVDAQSNAASSPTFFTLDNPGDLNFNQLLGISDFKVIVGYFGDGRMVLNNGYVLVPQNHYSVEKFTNLPSGVFETQTQAIGINNREVPEIVGFYIDSTNSNVHGFLDALGVQNTVDDPAGVTGIAVPTQNLLGINDNNYAAGFWTDNNANEHGFVVKFGTDSSGNLTTAFTEVPPSLFKGAVADQVSGITDNEDICGSRLLWPSR